ncbi:MAG: DUF6338 family protein [Nitrosopumilus sp.]|nr:DUF6338 family protein [Nitrosopumilus sp.]
MAEIPSLTETFVVIILIAPGFLTFRLLIWRAKYEFVFTDLQTTLWSLISSVIVFIPFSLIWGFDSIDDVEQKVLQSSVIASYFVLSVALGLGFGEIIRHLFRKNIIQGSVWVSFAFANVGDWVNVDTSKGSVYRGWIRKMSSHDIHKRELELGDPEILEEHENGKKIWKSVGYSVFFTELDIIRITRLK